MVSDGYAHRYNSVEYDAKAERLLTSVLLAPGSSAAPFSARPGRRVNGSGLEVSVAGSSPEQVTVAPGAGVAYRDTQAAAGPYLFEIPAPVVLDLPARPGSGQSRIDLIVARIYDVDASIGSVREVKIERVAGTPSGSPAAPSLPGLSVELARLTVPASGSISVSQTGGRTTAAGGIAPVATTAERDALPTYSGLTVWNEQTGQMETHNGTAWAPSRGTFARRLLRRTLDVTVLHNTTLDLTGGWGTVDGDDGNDTGISLSSGVLTLNAAGIYEVKAQMLWASTVSGNRRIDLLANNTSITYSNVPAGGIATAHINIEQRFDAGTQLRLTALQSSGSNLNLVTGSPSDASRWTVKRMP